MFIFVNKNSQIFMLNTKTSISPQLHHILSRTIFKSFKKFKLWLVHKKTEWVFEITKYWANIMHVHFIVITKSNKKRKEDKENGTGWGLNEYFQQYWINSTNSM